ncbi:MULTISPECIES: DUF1656 domain-containing protein [Vibrio]|uniref:DUF1656 domain-containing protein n=1 Tax=Vibrio TaxID=662 RepID=UPI00056FDE36|nr:DUF1656 domain-containing protein [Vibrio pacinii]
MIDMPHELVWGEVYLPPLLVTVAIAYALAMLVSSVAVKTGFHRHVALPAVVEVCLVVIFTGIIGQFIAIF